MGHTQPLPSPQELLAKLPLPAECHAFIQKSRTEIQNILDGQDSRLLVIVGPCSIHDITAAKEYATKLQQLIPQIDDTFKIIMRVYFEKPRTSLGWKGILYDPWLDGSHDLETGLHWTRKLLLDLADMNIPAATEFLEPAAAGYFSDLISWGCIGARTSTSQTHRQIASGLQMPIGFKNSIDGNITSAINGILNASISHTHFGINPEGQISAVCTNGNPYAHIVLRGSKHGPNYDPQSILEAIESLRQFRLPERLLVDCSHDNAERKAEKQISVFQSVLHQALEGNANIRGLLLESHLFGENQKFTANSTQLKYGVSITDPCLNWQTTECLLLWGQQFLKQESVAEKYFTDYAISQRILKKTVL